MNCSTLQVSIRTRSPRNRWNGQIERLYATSSGRLIASRNCMCLKLTNARSCFPRVDAVGGWVGGWSVPTQQSLMRSLHPIAKGYLERRNDCRCSCPHNVRSFMMHCNNTVVLKVVDSTFGRERNQTINAMHAFFENEKGCKEETHDAHNKLMSQSVKMQPCATVKACRRFIHRSTGNRVLWLRLGRRY